MSEINNAGLTQDPVAKTLIKLAIPMVVGLLSVVVFNITDTFFIGKLGTKELAALSFTFPVVLIIATFGVGLGAGTSAVISREIGKGEYKKASILSIDALFLTLAIACIFIVAGYSTFNFVFKLLGADSATMPLIKQYMMVWYSAVPFVFLPMVGNSIIRSGGNTKIPSLIMLIAAISNAVLDPFLIFGIGPFPRLGIQGAAIATCIARGLALIASLWYLRYKQKLLYFQKHSFKKILDSWKPILYIGLPTAGTSIIIPISVGIITRMLSSYGHEAVAGFGVGSRIDFFALIIVSALGVVLGPFIGQNLGAKKIGRILYGVHFSIWFSLLWGLLMFAVILIGAEKIAFAFNRNARVTTQAVAYLRIIPISYGLQGVILLIGSALNVLHKPMHALAIRLIHILVLYIPLAFIGKHYFGVKGIFLGVAVSYIIGGILAWKVVYRMLPKEEQA
ncbi:MAG: MATE family efflux transporter [Elusimicrobiota bacterium]